MTKKAKQTALKIVKTKKAHAAGRRNDKVIVPEVMQKINEEQEMFCRKYVLSRCNGTNSVLESYKNVTTRQSAAAMASRLLNNVKIQERIQELKQSVEETNGTSLPWMVDEVIKMAEEKDSDKRFKLECLRFLSDLLGYAQKNNVQVIMQQNNLFQDTQNEFKDKLG